MPIIEPTPIEAAPDVPDRADRATFPIRMYNAWVYLFGAFRTGITNMATNAYNNAIQAYNAAQDAAGSADTADTSAQTAVTHAGIATTKASEALASANAAAAIAGAFVGTSTSSIEIGLGAKTFATQSGEQYTSGIWMTAVSAANSANWMFGQVTSYSGTALQLDVQATGGSGIFADWNLSLTGARGPAGTGITPQSVGFSMSGGDTPKTLTVQRTITLTGTDGITVTLPEFDAELGSRNIPINKQVANYTCALADRGKSILHPSSDTAARTFTIDSVANVGWPLGTALTFENQAGAGVLSIAITTDTMRLAGAGTTGTRTLAANGIATAHLIAINGVNGATATEWIISGTGLT